jgi:hypothetical protein
MNKHRECIQSARNFPNIDHQTGFRLTGVKVGEEWKLAFRIRYGLYEYTVMPFGLANTAATFQNAMETIFGEMLDRGLLIYMDDFLFYPDSEAEHSTIFLDVHRQLKEYNLAIWSNVYGIPSRLNFLVTLHIQWE